MTTEFEFPTEREQRFLQGFEIYITRTITVTNGEVKKGIHTEKLEENTDFVFCIAKYT